MVTQTVPSPWRRYARLSLRGLIVFVLVVGGALGWIVDRAKIQRDAVAAIEKAGGRVWYDWEWELKDGRPNSSGKPRWPRWLLDHLGPDYFAQVAAAELTQGGSDEQMVPVAKTQSSRYPEPRTCVPEQRGDGPSGTA